jgi:hypothetical protein
LGWVESELGARPTLGFGQGLDIGPLGGLGGQVMSEPEPEPWASWGALGLGLTGVLGLVRGVGSRTRWPTLDWI